MILIVIKQFEEPARCNVVRQPCHFYVPQTIGIRLDAHIASYTDAFFTILDRLFVTASFTVGLFSVVNLFSRA